MGHPGPTGTKLDILKLLVRQELSAQQLADSLSVTAAAIRQHLETLEALGLVVKRKLVTQPSRPTFLYRLSPQGARAFPKRYDLMLGLVVDVLSERHGPAELDDVIRAAARRLAERASGRLGAAGSSHRWKQVADWLEQELAWHADVHVANGGRRITIYQCPFQDVASDHPELCATFFSTLIGAVYGEVTVERAAPPACCAVLSPR